MQSCDCVRREDPDWDLLSDNSLAVAATKVLIERRAVSFVVVGGRWKRTVRVRGRRRDDRECEYRHVILLGEANLGRRSIHSRLEGAIERGKRYFEVDDIVGSRLDTDRLEDGVLRDCLARGA